VAVENLRGSSLLAGRDLSHGELKGLIESCANDRKICGIRDAAIIAFLYTCGPRRQKWRTVQCQDIGKEI
jgi:site-specific recombinase XerD